MRVPQVRVFLPHSGLDFTFVTYGIFGQVVTGLQWHTFFDQVDVDKTVGPQIVDFGGFGAL